MNWTKQSLVARAVPGSPVVWIILDEAGLKVAIVEEAAQAALIAAAPELLASVGQLLRLVDGLPWHTRDAVYKAFNERTGGLPGSLPAPIVAARAAIAKAEGGAK